MHLVPTPTSTSLPAPLRDWRWRTQEGLMLRPCIMETRHLHHTLVMIWHHTMSEDARLRPYYRRYSFGPFYSKEYMRQAVRVMFAELVSRTDLTAKQIDELRRMRDYLNPIAGHIGRN